MTTRNSQSITAYYDVILFRIKYSRNSRKIYLFYLGHKIIILLNLTVRETHNFLLEDTLIIFSQQY